MSNDKDFLLKNAVEVGGSVKTTVGTVTYGGEGYDIANASYDSKNFSFTSQEPNPADITFNGDGTKVYVIGTAFRTIYQYSLSTAYDISTASYDSVNFSVNSQDTGSRGIRFNNDGTKLYMVGTTNDSVYQYSLSTAYDVSTASYDNVSFSVASQEGLAFALAFNNAGTKLYIAGGSSDTIYQYSLSSAFDLSTASYDSISLHVVVQDGSPSGIAFNSDGTKMFMMGAANDTVFQYSLSTGFDLSTASYDSVSFSVSSQEADLPNCLAFNSDGTKMYIAGNTNDTIYQYSTVKTTATLDLSTGNYFSDTLATDTTYTLSNAGDVQAFQLEVTGSNPTYDIGGASYANLSFSVATQAPTAEDVFISEDGTKMYVLCRTNDAVYQYSLSTAYDVSTASYASKSFSVAGQETSPSGLFFKSDGTKMYVIGYIGDDVNEYNLSVPWDVSTASFLQSFSVISQASQPHNLFFKQDDGTQMYVVSNTPDKVFKYTLTTGWDVSTASFDGEFDFSSQVTVGYGVWFSSDGQKMFILDDSTGAVYQYNLTTAWDLSTSSYSGISFNLPPENTAGWGMCFSSDGTKMYIPDATDDLVYQYSTGSANLLTWPTSIEWADGVAPGVPVNGETDVFTITTDDSGTTYIGVQTADNLS